MKLYEVKHPYYCESQNYFQRMDSATETYFRFDCWESFHKEAKDWDDDWNYLFRWDWEPEWIDEDGEYESIPEHLKLYFFRQRKGFHVTMHINVTKEDEPQVKEYLIQKSKNLKATWFPILNSDEEIKAGKRLEVKSEN